MGKPGIAINYHLVSGAMENLKKRMGDEKMTKQVCSRILKVEEVGDFWRNQTKPRVRLEGKWLAYAGILPNHYVSIENPNPGTLIIRLVDRRESI
jgi:hypothetical protein